MERLTFEGKFCDIAQCRETPGGSFCEDGSCSQRKVWERLKAYEDAEEQRLITPMVKVPILNYTTKVSALRSCMEIQTILAKHGAKKNSAKLFRRWKNRIHFLFDLHPKRGKGDPTSCQCYVCK